MHFIKLGTINKLYLNVYLQLLNINVLPLSVYALQQKVNV